MRINRVRKVGALGLLVLCCLCLAGCTFRPLTEKDVVGTYEANAQWGGSTLVLHPDHSFDQTVTRDDHTKTHIKGTWKLDLLAGKNYGIIVLQNFLAVDHDHEGKIAGWAGPSISRGLLWGITIAADPDYGISFDKD